MATPTDVLYEVATDEQDDSPLSKRTETLEEAVARLEAHVKTLELRIVLLERNNQVIRAILGNLKDERQA